MNVLEYVTQNIHHPEIAKGLVKVIIDEFSFHEYLTNRNKSNNVIMTL